MSCPFLQEARVGQCACSALRVMVVRPSAGGHERCSSPDYAGCPAYLQEPELEPQRDRCPYLDETPMQYCSAAPVVKYIPPAQSPISRCATDRYRYCDLYLALAEAGRDPGDAWVEKIRMPARLWYAPNHMWMDPGENGACVVGIDGFLAAALGRVERLRLPNPSGLRWPSAVVTVRGVDLELAFPRPLSITGSHNHLRAKPAVLTEDPYGQGWLFEGRTADTAGLMRGSEAKQWMQGEVDRLSKYVHGHLERVSPALQADGGTFGGDMLEHLSRDEIAGLFDEFFPPRGREETHS